MRQTYKPMHESDAEGWTEWVSPSPRQPYRMACCDCGLVHDLEFRAIEVREKRGGWWEWVADLLVPYRVLFRVRRNERETAKLRAREAA